MKEILIRSWNPFRDCLSAAWWVCLFELCARQNFAFSCIILHFLTILVVADLVICFWARNSVLSSVLLESTIVSSVFLRKTDVIVLHLLACNSNTLAGAAVFLLSANVNAIARVNFVFFQP